MALYLNSSDDLAAMISAASGVTVTSSMFTIAAMKPTTTAEQAGVANGKNTKVHVVMNSGATLRGEMTLYYDRLNLSQLSNFNPYLLSANPNGIDITALLATFFNQYGFTLTMNDLADAVSSQDANGNTQITLTALSTSLGFTGTFNCKFAPLPPISGIFYSNILAGF
jgi:hypothetical protein